jgi:hypothetical protein
MNRPSPLGNAAEYLMSTQSAVRHLFDAIEEYRALLRGGILRGPSGFSRDDDPDAVGASIDVWMQENAQAIEDAFESQRRYSAERFAMATLCGAVIQVAQKGLEVHSINRQVPEGLPDCIRGKLARYCVGTSVRSIPRGLIIYAARNQHFHFNDPELGKPSREVFDRLALNHGSVAHAGQKDPAFDVGKHSGSSLAAAVVHLIGWRDYSAYESDMRSMLGVPAEA